MKLPRRQFLHLAAGATALPAVSRIAAAQAYPSRPVPRQRPLCGCAAPPASAPRFARAYDIIDAKLFALRQCERTGRCRSAQRCGAVRWFAHHLDRAGTDMTRR
jgi:hypothetical protein